MKNTQWVILMTMLALVGCTQRPMLNEGGSSSLLKYYVYNPDDTIENYLFLEMLRIDSARVEYLVERPYGLLPLEIMEELVEGQDSVDLQKIYKEGDEIIFNTVVAKWHEMMRLCSQKQYEELLSMYIKEETDIGIALANSTNKFALDYYVIGKLLFAQLDEEKATEIFAKFLEFDKFMTESVILLGQSKSGYVPPQYAFQLDILCRAYLILGKKEKAEALIEPYRNAVYLLSDDALQNEDMIAKFKSDIYEEFGDLDGEIETAVGYRDFLKKYAKDTDRNLDEEISKFDSLIKKMENEL